MKMLADLGQNLSFPAEIASTDLRPVEVVFEWMRLRYAELAADVHQWGWRAKTGPVEVGCRRSVPTSTSRLLRDMGVREKAHRQAGKDLPLNRGSHC